MEILTAAILTKICLPYSNKVFHVGSNTIEYQIIACLVGYASNAKCESCIFSEPWRSASKPS